jgi:hypothetical protein
MSDGVKKTTTQKAITKAIKAISMRGFFLDVQM